MSGQFNWHADQLDYDYKFIPVCQDHLIKFVQLWSFKSKRAEEIIYNLLGTFTILGTPSILQSDNGHEFCNHIIQDVCAIWSELKIVHGKPRHSQSQESVEQTNQVFDNLDRKKLNSALVWDLRFVQSVKNRFHHQGINWSQYEVIFGIPAKVCIKI